MCPKSKAAKSPNCFKESADLQMLQLWDILTDMVWQRLNKRWRLLRLLGHKLLLTLLPAKSAGSKLVNINMANLENTVTIYSNSLRAVRWKAFLTEGHFWQIRRKVSTAICWTPGKVSCMNSKSLKITVFKNFQCAPGSKSFSWKKGDQPKWTSKDASTFLIDIKIYSRCIFFGVELKNPQ